MSRRRAGWMIVLLVIGAAFVLEGWTFLDLIRMQCSDSRNETTERSSTGSPKRKSIGDEVSFGSGCTARIQTMYVHAGRSGWRFRIVVAFTNSGTTPMRIVSRQFQLTSGDHVSVQRSFSVPAEGTTTKRFAAEIPDGMEVNRWILNWSEHPAKRNWKNRVVSLGKAPVRRTE